MTPALGTVHTCCATRGPQEPCHRPASQARSASVALGGGTVVESSPVPDGAALSEGEGNTAEPPDEVGRWPSVTAGIPASNSSETNASRMIWRIFMRTGDRVRTADFPLPVY